MNGPDAEPAGDHCEILERVHRAGNAVFVQHSVFVDVAHEIQVDPLLGDDLDPSARVDLHDHRARRARSHVDYGCVALLAVALVSDAGVQRSQTEFRLCYVVPKDWRRVGI